MRWHCPFCGLEFDEQPQPHDCPACERRLVDESHWDGMTSQPKEKAAMTPDRASPLARVLIRQLAALLPRDADPELFCEKGVPLATAMLLEAAKQGERDARTGKAAGPK